MNRVKNFIGAMRERGVRTVKRAVPAFFYCILLFQYVCVCVCACVCGKSIRNLSDHIRI